jgi:hypothetical protein
MLHANCARTDLHSKDRSEENCSKQTVARGESDGVRNGHVLVGSQPLNQRDAMSIDVQEAM